MNMPWLRLYVEIVDDEKLRLLAFEDRWHYVALLCCKGKGILDNDNHVLMRRMVAVKLGLDVRELDEVSRRLAEVGLIDQVSLQPTGWENRQFKSDNSTERVREWRRNNPEKQKRNHDERSRNNDETLQQRSSNALDTDTDTDKEAKASLSEPADAASDPATGGDDNSSEKNAIPACPHQEIIALYHEILPELPTVILSRWRGSEGEAHLRTRWREDPRHQDLAFWERFFRTIRTSKHWMGENDRNWRADLRWVLKRGNFDKVIERLVDNLNRAEAGND